MALKVVKRRPRLPAPPLPRGSIELESPPELPESSGRNWSQMLMVIPMLAGAGAMMMMFSMRSGGAGGEGMMTMRLIMGGMFALSMLGMVAIGLLTGGKGQSKQEMFAMRRDYLRRLAQVRRQAKKVAKQQRKGMFYRHPDPSTLWQVPSSARIWERRPEDGDFTVTRIGLGPQQLATTLELPESKPVDDLEPVCSLALRSFVENFGVIDGLPVAMDLRGFHHVYLEGDSERCRSMLRATVAQLATWHSIDRMLIATAASGKVAEKWDFCKWLPHNLHPEKTDALGAIRLSGTTVQATEERLGDILSGRPRFDATSSPWDGQHVVVIIEMVEKRPKRIEAGAMLLTIEADGEMSMATADHESYLGIADQLSLIEVSTLARQLTPMRFPGNDDAAMDDDDTSGGLGKLGFTDLLNIGDAYHYEAERAWSKRPGRNRLRVPIGVDTAGLPIDLDIKEAAQMGMGPHGLMIGATGSGKSEALRTLVLAMAAVHSPDELNLVLVDFKGGATFTRLDKLPHTSAVITNLSDELVLVDRMKDAINGETLRRQELLRSAGKFSSLKDYEKAREAGQDLEPLPSLWIICDEFSELLSAKPDFIEMFAQIGRVGRSLGIHLLLASQRLDEGQLRGLTEHLSYRISLRTFSAMESRAVLGVSDAFDLPREPGHGYIKFGTEPLQRFKASYVSGVYTRSSTKRYLPTMDGENVPFYEYTSDYVEKPPEPEPEVIETEEHEDESGATLLDLLVERMEGKGRPAHKVWLDPLNEPPTLDQLLPPTKTIENRGLQTDDPALWGNLKVPVALVDKPFEQRRDVQWVSLAGANGHLAIAGGSQTGKSTLLRTVITGMALTHTPNEIQFYCLDFGGGALSTVRDLPHVGSIYQRLDRNEVRRTIAEVNSILESREQRFARMGIDSMPTYRKMRAEGQVTDDPFGDVFLVVDGWQVFKDEFEALDGSVTKLIQRGLSYGVHVIVAASRWADIRFQIKEAFGTQLELKIGDNFDSLGGRKGADQVPSNTPGRGVMKGALQTLAALPRIDSEPNGDSVVEGVLDLVKEVKKAWDGPGAPKVRLLPEKLAWDDLQVSQYDEKDKWKIPIGIAESNLQPVKLDLVAEPHFMYFSDVETGKSTFLRSFIKSITARAGSKEAQFVLLDYRRSLLGAVPEDQLVKHCSTSEQTHDIINSITSAAKKRLPPEDVTPKQLRERSWWDGPEMFLIVDDYDLVASAYDNPFVPLMDFLPQGRDIGLHIILTRGSGGAGRTLYESFVRRMKDLATPGFQGSTPKSEGVVLVKPGQLPDGRGWLVSRRGEQLIQTAWLPEEV